MNENFIEIYKKLEAFANKKFNRTGRYMPMSQLTDEMIAHIPGAQEFATDFELFNNMRNMLQHKEADRYFVIQPEVVALISHVYDVVTKPLTVGEFFSSPVVFVIESDNFASLISHVRNHHHTQFPVINTAGVVMRKIVTPNAITHALTESENPSVTKIIQKSQTLVKFIAQTESIFTAEKMLLDEMRTGRKSVVLLITKTKKTKNVHIDDVVGLINVANLPQILAKK
ncbi:hypothetical protein Hs30E_16070 [Lactococcus hodotermopsidis]|uniref:CBS domain-containing protein n=1 Tax=Pseudolactococcus hodotermopsidis TaxID=2709157 RepID=A0A6A0BE24_9LACT|nr:hypothetical protein [Lactococcus hodotermopsidis]GFH43056.1 hypothetical protein Hs30E_16070 [Lactococcus hodotermopsidis]